MIRTEKENKVTHRSESSQPILRHRERRSTSPSCITPPPSHPNCPLTPPSLLQSSYSGCLSLQLSKAARRGSIPPQKGSTRLTRRAAASHWRRLRLPPVASPRNGLCHHFLLCHHFPRRATSSSAPGLGTRGKTLWNSLEKKMNSNPLKSDSSQFCGDCQKLLEKGRRKVGLSTYFEKASPVPKMSIGKY